MKSREVGKSAAEPIQGLHYDNVELTVLGVLLSHERVKLCLLFSVQQRANLRVARNRGSSKRGRSSSRSARYSLRV